MTIDVVKTADSAKGEAGAPETGIFRDPFWRVALDGRRLPGEADVHDRLAEAIAVQISRFTGQYVPPSECKAVVALIALANAKYGMELFRLDVGLRNLERLEPHPCNENIGDAG